MTSMMKFLRTNSSFSPGNRATSTTPDGNRTESQATFVRQKRSRQIPPPLQLNGEMDEDGVNSNGKNTFTSRSEHAAAAPETPARRGSNRKIAESASKFPFYHAYLTEDQEEDAFKQHLFKTGSFLMRDSKSNVQAVTMSVVIDPHHLYHFQVVQASDYFYVVGTGKQFATLADMIEYYKGHNIPGKMDDPVFLKLPVVCHEASAASSSQSSIPSAMSTPRRNGPTTPNFTTVERPRRRIRKGSSQSNLREDEETRQHGSPKHKTFVRPPLPEVPLPEDPLPELYENPEAVAASASRENGQETTPPDIDFRPPMPIPRPVSSGKGHDYSEADHPDLDRIKMVLELCRQSDVIHASRKKCTCGLYLEESILTHNWMMHVDNEPGKTQGRIFFLDTKTNMTTWSLPDEVLTELKSQFPVKWEFVKKQMAASKRKNSTP